jgi:hypothetical protein
MKALKVLLYSSASLLLITAVGLFAWLWWQRHLPSDEETRRQFDSHKADYVRLVSLVRQDQSVRFVSSDGRVNAYTGHPRAVPEYRDIIRRIGAKYVTVREDGSMEFAL